MEKLNLKHNKQSQGKSRQESCQGGRESQEGERLKFYEYRFPVPVVHLIPETGRHVFLNPKTGAPYRLHEFYYLHKRILKQAGLPWVAFRNLQRQCMEVGI